ncbi:DUF3619 family protein [Marinobacter alexandrii]|jgi:hypothetical protein|uniref:DUF3619 family protein n=1 Tax=Marinobacter alexandrii TaxID=2570351 RepID=UPI0011084E16|nr:DUF3619 family protein [Marinobacter alexandrii]MCK2149417.1 DUF3619 family protein [Marinobacter alexandrii]
MNESNGHDRNDKERIDQERNDQDWQDAEGVRRVLDASNEQLPGDIQARLRQAREAAVGAKSSPAWQSKAAWYGAAASVALAVTIGLLWPEDSATDLADEEMLYAMAELGEEEWSVVRDLEFVYWLSEQPDEAPEDAKRSADRPG